MNKAKIYVDGQVGTTGLQIIERLQFRTDIELLRIPEDKRKDEKTRRDYLNSADLVFLCLPDEASRQAVAWIENSHTKVIDASTAHRTMDGWTYGFPELAPVQRDAIRQAKRLANPGCHPTGFLSIVRPLREMNILAEDTFLHCISVTGYSGGGKEMMEEYEGEGRAPELDSPRLYGLSFAHKHIPEMMKYGQLAKKPMFLPIVADYPCGMAVSVTLVHNGLAGNPRTKDLRDVLAAWYRDEPFIHVAEFDSAPGFLASNAHVGTNVLELHVHGNDTQSIITARLDNLGKGASGAAVQNMNLMIEFSECAGL